jgi:hypothetical protein
MATTPPLDSYVVHPAALARAAAEQTNASNTADYDFALAVMELAVKALPPTADAGAHAKKADELWGWITSDSPPKVTP